MSLLQFFFQLLIFVQYQLKKIFFLVFVLFLIEIKGKFKYIDSLFVENFPLKE